MEIFIIEPINKRDFASKCKSGEKRPHAVSWLAARHVELQSGICRIKISRFVISVGAAILLLIIIVIMIKTMLVYNFNCTAFFQLFSALSKAHFAIKMPSLPTIWTLRMSVYTKSRKSYKTNLFRSFLRLPQISYFGIYQEIENDY